MKRSLFMAVGMSALLLVALLPTSVTARSPERFGRVDLNGQQPNLDRLALNRDPN